MNYWQLVDKLERIGDEIKRIAKCLKDINLDSKGFKKLVDLCSQVENFYIGVMNAYHKNDLTLLYKTLKLKDNLLEECNNYFN